jgi:ribonuclease Z
VSLRRLKLDTSWGQLQLVGGSRAGEGTLVLLPQLHLGLDPGRPHRALPPMRTVVLSHGHLDHIGAVGYWASQRYLNSMPPATLIVSDEISRDVGALLAAFARLEGGRPYEVELISVVAGSSHWLRRDLELRFFATDHWVPTLGTRIVWHKKQLRPELATLPGTEIARRRRAGEEVSQDIAISIVSYCADSGPGIFEAETEVLASEVVLMECSFFKPGDRDRAARYGHTHLDDLLPHLGDLQCRHLVLLHASRRHRIREIERILDEEVRPRFAGTLHNLNVDWE